MSHGATARLFVALDPPPEIRGELAAWAHEAVAALAPASRSGRRAGVRVLDPDSLHLTLCFLGSRPAGELGPLAGALASATGAVGALELGAPLLLPARRPRALAVEVRDGAGELVALRDRVAGALAAVSDWTPERRRLRAHITVARMSEDTVGGRRPGPPIVFAPAPSLRFTPTTVVLYRSRLEPSGAIYEALAERELPPAWA